MSHLIRVYYNCLIYLYLCSDPSSPYSYHSISHTRYSIKTWWVEKQMHKWMRNCILINTFISWIPIVTLSLSPMSIFLSQRLEEGKVWIFPSYLSLIVGRCGFVPLCPMRSLWSLGISDANQRTSNTRSVPWILQKFKLHVTTQQMAWRASSRLCIQSLEWCQIKQANKVLSWRYNYLPYTKDLQCIT